MAPRPRNRDRLSVYLLSSALFVAGALLALLVTRGYAVDIDSLTLQKRGVIVLRSDPDSAEIRLDGQRTKKRTDVRLSLAPETYRFEVRAPGRIPWQREVRLDSGEAVIEEITLFPESPERTVLAKLPVVRFNVSPDGGTVAAVLRRSGATYLRLLDDGGGVRFEVRIGADPQRVVVSDEGFVLTERPGKVTVYAPSGRTDAVLAGQSGGFAGKSVVFQRERRVITTDRSGKGGRTLATAPRGWIPAGGDVYVLDRAGRVIRANPDGGKQPVDGAVDVAAIGTVGSDTIQATKRDGSFGIIRNGSFKAIASEPARASLSPDGGFLVYRTGREIRLFELATGKDRLVTSLTKPPERITTLPGGHYVLYRQGTDLHAMARDGSNDRVVAGAVGSEPVVLALDRIIVKDSRTGLLTRLNLQD